MVTSTMSGQSAARPLFLSSAGIIALLVTSAGGIVVSYTEGGVYDHDYNYFRFDDLVHGIDEPIDTLTLHPDGTYSRGSETLSVSEAAELYPLVTDFDWQQFYSVQE